MADVRAEAIRHDFRGKHHNEQLFRFTGPNATELVKPEEEGLRIQFGEGKTPAQPVGVYWPHFISGDFKATARYEILKIGPVSKGVGVGIEVYMMLDNPARDGIFIAHIQSSTMGPLAIRAGHMTNDEHGKRVAKYVKRIPLELGPLRGRLRVEREKANLTVSFAPEDAEEFKTLFSAEMGDADVRMLRFAGLGGGEPNASVDARLLEFDLEGSKLGHEGRIRVPVKDRVVAKAGEGTKSEPPPEPQNRTYLIALVSLGLFLSAVAGFGFYLRRRVQNASSTNHQAPTTRPATSSAETISFTCECGKSGRVKPEFAGKRIKCPNCGKAVQL